MTVYWAALLILWLTFFFIAEKALAILFPLPAAERGDHTRSCSGGVFVLLLCISPGARTRCGPFSAIVQLHSAASWLTGSILINKKKNAPIVDLRPLLQVCPSSHVINIEMNLCQYLRINGYTGYSIKSLLWLGDYHKQFYGCTDGCVIRLNNTAYFKFLKSAVCCRDHRQAGQTE